MNSFYCNLAQENIKKRKRKRKRERVKNAIVLKKNPKMPKKPNFKKAVIAGS
jgi:hypothetical protein